MADICTPEYATELAEAYMHTLKGETAQDPVGWWCTPGDVTKWKLVVDRIRAAIAEAVNVNANANVQMPADLKESIAKWALQSMKISEGSFFPHAGRRFCEEDVTKAINFASDGVKILAAVHCAAKNLGGIVPDPPPMSTETYDPGLPGPDAVWYLGGGLLALLLFLLIKRQRG